MSVSVAVHTSPGFEDYTLQFVQGLSSYARVVYLLDVHQRERFLPSIPPGVHVLPFRRPRRRHVWWGGKEMARVARLLRQMEIEIVHMQGYGLWESVLRRMLPFPAVNTVHDPVNHVDYQTPLNNWLLRDSVQQAQGYVVHSETMKRVLIQTHKVASAPILVHPIGMYQYYTQFARPESRREPYILFFGEPRINKGIDILLQAFWQVRDQLQPWTLVVAGRGSLPQQAAVWAQRLGGRLIHKNYFIPDEEVATLFARAGMVVLPYRHGTQSGVLPLAAAFACPVLATPVGNMREIVQEDEHVRFVRPGDVNALAQAMADLVKNEALRQQLGENLHRQAAEHWSWDEIGRKTVAFYRRVLAQTH